MKKLLFLFGIILNTLFVYELGIAQSNPVLDPLKDYERWSLDVGF